MMLNDLSPREYWCDLFGKNGLLATSATLTLRYRIHCLNPRFSAVELQVFLSHPIAVCVPAIV